MQMALLSPRLSLQLQPRPCCDQVHLAQQPGGGPGGCRGPGDGCQGGGSGDGIQRHPGQALRDRQELEEQPHLLRDSGMNRNSVPGSNANGIALGGIWAGGRGSLGHGGEGEHNNIHNKKKDSLNTVKTLRNIVDTSIIRPAPGGAISVIQISAASA